MSTAAADLAALRDLMPFAVLTGLELLEATPGQVRAQLAWSEQRCTAGGVLHGGALMTLADSCGGVCAYLNMPESAQGTATIESKTSFLRAVRDGVVTAVATPLHRGRTLIVVETELRLADGALVTKTSQTQAYHFARD